MDKSEKKLMSLVFGTWTYGLDGWVPGKWNMSMYKRSHFRGILEALLGCPLLLVRCTHCDSEGEIM